MLSSGPQNHFLNFGVRSKPNPDYAHFAGQNFEILEEASKDLLQVTTLSSDQALLFGPGVVVLVRENRVVHNALDVASIECMARCGCQQDGWNRIIVELVGFLVDRIARSRIGLR